MNYASYRKIRNSKANNKGFTLIELLLVIVILAIVASIVVPSINGIVERVKEKVCIENRLRVERAYDEVYIFINDVNHNELLFAQYLQEYKGELCPQNGDISYADGKI